MLRSVSVRFRFRAIARYSSTRSFSSSDETASAIRVDQSAKYSRLSPSLRSVKFQSSGFRATFLRSVHSSSDPESVPPARPWVPAVRVADAPPATINQQCRTPGSLSEAWSAWSTSHLVLVPTYYFLLLTYSLFCIAYYRRVHGPRGPGG